MKVIIKANTPTKIPYMENPPAQGGEIKYLTADEFKKKFNCEYTEGVVVEGKYKKLNPATESDFKNASAKAAYERLLNPLDSLVICKMSHGIGHGLFTTKDIPMGTVICIYAGQYDPFSKEFVYSNESIDAAKVGGFARFMQHQPFSKEGHEYYLMQGLKDPHLFAIQENITQEEAKALLVDSGFVAKKTEKYKEKIKDNLRCNVYNFSEIVFSDKQLATEIAQSNVFCETTVVADVEVTLMVAMRDIKANESIGFSYGVVYWQHPSIKNQPLLFTKTGEILSLGERYKYKSNKALEEAVGRLHGNPFFGLSSNAASSTSMSDSSDEELDTSDVFANSGKTLARLMKLMQSIPDSKHSDNATRTSSSTMQPNPKFAIAENKQELLDFQSMSFFENLNVQWRKYPENRLTGKYVGHQVCFFTMPASSAETAKNFTQHLKQTGFDAELKSANGKPSIVVDLTASKLTYK